jgi:hypothetical protein
MKTYSIKSSTRKDLSRCSRRTTLTIQGRWFSSPAIMPPLVKGTLLCREVAQVMVVVGASEVAEVAKMTVLVTSEVDATLITMILLDTRICSRTRRGKSSPMMTSSDDDSITNNSLLSTTV